MYYTYILQLKDKSKYVGYSSDLKKRIKDHNKGLIQSTKNLRPVKLVYYSAFISKLNEREVNVLARDITGPQKLKLALDEKVKQLSVQNEQMEDFIAKNSDLL